MRALAPCLALATSLALSGCITLPASQAELRAAASGTLEFTVERPLEDAYRIVADNLARCEEIATDADRLAMAGTQSASGGKVIAAELDTAGGSAWISVHFSNMAATGYLQLVDLQRIDATRTRIVQHRLNESAKWHGAGVALRGWFEGRSDCSAEA